MSKPHTAPESLVEKHYRYGFISDIESEIAPKGLSETTIRFLSAKKNEPEWLLNWRLEAFALWQKMKEPHWAKLNYPPIDYQSFSYYAAPKQKGALQNLDDVDPRL
jgi:Fe-S cluster assembly protein SufB